ncbi:hypothetical protein [Rhizorhabdus sp. FW153]|uniref:hypothetical protein n=1 Tax=Rhizorhabdus sp. FW153 TaxID=3400216 RepID=UPI003CEA456D
MTMRILLATAAMAVLVPAAGQAQQTSAAIAATAEMPETRALNNGVNQAIVETKTANAVAMAQADINQQDYEADKAAYAKAMRQYRRDVMATDASFARQQDAYAMAMRDWRAQVVMCKKGHQSACNLPTPDPRNYM